MSGKLGLIKVSVMGVLFGFLYLLGILIGAFVKVALMVLVLAFIYMILAFLGVVPPVDYIPILPLV